MLSRKRIRARDGLEYHEPRFLPWVYQFMRLISPSYLRFAEGIAKIEQTGIDHLIGAYQKFYRQQARLLIVFRHPSVHDPPLMAHFMCRCLPAEARRQRQKLGGRGHAHFLYGRGVLHWAGGGARFLIPRIAGIPVMNRRNDTRGLRTIRRCLSTGPFPLCLAPEGQVSYHNHSLGPVEGGTARMALWCLEDLQQQGRAEEILILPVACHYLYRNNPQALFDSIVDRICAQTGLLAPSGSRYEMLLEQTEGLLRIMESLYARFWPPAERREQPAGLRDRIEAVCHAALNVPEQFMSIRPAQDLLSRVLTVRQRGWDYFFRSDLSRNGKISPMDRVLMDRLADETYLHLRHNELVDVLEYVNPEYITAGSPLNRLIEYALNLADVVNRLMGGDISSRYSPPGKTVYINIGEPIKVRESVRSLTGKKRDRAEGLMKVIVAALTDLSRDTFS